MNAVPNICATTSAEWEANLFPAIDLVPHWYVAQTCSRHEKRIADQLERRGIDHFLPLYEKVSRWKDRYAKVQLPLFAGYIFLRLPLLQRLRALEISGVVRLVAFGHTPVPVPDNEIEALRNGLANRLRVERHPFLTVGRRVQVRSGPLAGLQGILLRKKGTFRLVLSLELIQRSVIADIDIADIEPMQQPQSVPLT